MGEFTFDFQTNHKEKHRHQSIVDDVMQ